MSWNKIIDVLPPEGKFVDTKIIDGSEERCHQKMKRKNSLWFLEDGTYVYYSPTHWKNISYYEKCSFNN